MSVLTEAMLRGEFKDADTQGMAEYRVPAGTIVTPSARAWLVDRKVNLVIGDKRVIRVPPPGGSAVRGESASQLEHSALPAFAKPDRFEVATGGFVEDKPEHLTALRENLLVPKDHKVIRFRGQLDSLEAQILTAQVAMRRLGFEKAVADLGEALSLAKQIMRAEVLEEPLAPLALLGLDHAELRRRSHNPTESFGTVHFAASVDDGEAVVALNLLRTKAREVELAAFDAFKGDGGQPPERGDILQALNRLSSAFYLMMFKAKVKEYLP